MPELVHSTVELGSKAVIAAGCVIGEHSSIGDKSSVKRSIVGATCRCDPTKAAFALSPFCLSECPTLQFSSNPHKEAMLREVVLHRFLHDWTAAQINRQDRGITRARVIDERSRPVHTWDKSSHSVQKGPDALPITSLNDVNICLSCLSRHATVVQDRE